MAAPNLLLFSSFDLYLNLSKLERGGSLNFLYAGGGREFHIARQLRDRYHCDRSLFSLSGNVIFPDFQAVRLLAQKWNEDQAHKQMPIRAGELAAMGLIDEILHWVFRLYLTENGGSLLAEAERFLEQRLGAAEVQKTLELFVGAFPPLAVYLDGEDPSVYLAGKTNGESHRHSALEELIFLWLANANPAFRPFLELFSDDQLRQNSAYEPLIAAGREFFADQPLFGPDRQDIVAMLRSPALAFPNSLPGQLRFIRERWGLLLDRFRLRLLGVFDLLREEEKPGWAGPGQTSMADIAGAFTLGTGFEPERFTPDTDWMPRLVMLAKSVYVWLDQLSRQYGRSICRLDQVPDEELDKLCGWGFTGLWLIGIWERSPASRRIKNMCGNAEAMASAYSLRSYEIAADLGGEAAFADLRRRAGQRGLRLATDMVPNHMGLDSPWVAEHPDWFIQLPHPPFPAYSFTGTDLSDDARIAVVLEDHYYDRSDAAVVFRWQSKQSGAVRYIYHGNDGTRMPWNDTAQLNFLLPEVREAVIHTILKVAAKVPIIRFDAAMTLTKRHFQRLWFPQPGQGGDIPSRSGFAVTAEQFEQAMPEEFWREVVERIAREAPDTLLLAEAFWLMESYFVRTLGMHRVYNSAFMNFLKEEDNAKFRYYVKNVLEFNREILRRFVNFMSNPDEETAVAQFGKGDKYFGVCTMMVTLPGLPMFGHGQIEGYQEKYGMEYSRAYHDEQADWDLVSRHQREIFPLLHRRHLFAGVEHFLFYDFFQNDGTVCEDVFAYSNRHGSESALVIYHNRYRAVAGWVRTAVAYAEKGADGLTTLVQKSLAEGLNWQGGAQDYLLFRDWAHGLEYIRSGQEILEKGLFVELEAYGRHVFCDVRQVRDNRWHHYRRLNESLGGRGVADIGAALDEIVLAAGQRALAQVVNGEVLQQLVGLSLPEATIQEAELFFDRLGLRLVETYNQLNRLLEGAADTQWQAAAALKPLRLVYSYLHAPAKKQRQGKAVSHDWRWRTEEIFLHADAWFGFFSLAVLFPLFPGSAAERLSWLEEWRSEKAFLAAFAQTGMEERRSLRLWQVVRIALGYGEKLRISLENKESAPGIVDSLRGDAAVNQWLYADCRAGSSLERFRYDEMLDWLALAMVLAGSAPGKGMVCWQDMARAWRFRQRMSLDTQD